MCTPCFVNRLDEAGLGPWTVLWGARCTGTDRHPVKRLPTEHAEHERQGSRLRIIPAEQACYPGSSPWP